MIMQATKLEHLVDQVGKFAPIRIAVAGAAQPVVIETLHEAHGLGFIEPRLVGEPDKIAKLCKKAGWNVPQSWIIAAATDEKAARTTADLVRGGEVEAIMKGLIHTDTLMRVLLDSEKGLRIPGERVSHVFVTEVKAYPKLLGITDAAINISPNLIAKSQILQNAIDLFHVLGVETPKVAVLSAVETINPDVVSTLDAACLTLMSHRGQINGALVEGPLAFDNAISQSAAQEKGIDSQVAGAADILLVPDLVSGNILAKNLEYLAGAIAAGVVIGLTVPVALTSRADPAPSRLASLALVAAMHRCAPKVLPAIGCQERSFHAAPQNEGSCCPI